MVSYFLNDFEVWVGDSNNRDPNKMIRYVGEKQIEMSSPKQTKKSRSSQKPIQTKSQLVANPEEYHTSSQALRQLKRHNDQTALLKGRLSVLQIHEEKNDFKAFMNEQRCKFHEEMRYELEQEKLRKSRHLKKVLNQINQSHEQALYHRKEHDYNLRKARNQVLSSKKKDYSLTKSQEKELEDNIRMLKREESQLKKSRNQEIREYERTQRDKVKGYLEQKRKQIHRNDSEDVGKFSRVKEEKKRQIEELSKLEQMMLERQARSKMVSQESEFKLKKMLKQPVSTSHTTKLPSIGAEKRQRIDTELFVL